MSAYSDFKDALLIALVAEADRTSHGQADANAIGAQIPLEHKEQWVRDAVDTFERQDYVRNVLRALGGTLIVGVTGEAREEVERLQQAMPSQPTSDPDDIIVTLDHSAEGYGKTQTAIEKLSTALAETNALPVPTAVHERLIAEINAGKALLKSPEIRLDAIEAVLVKTLRYIADKFADQIVGVIAGAALAALLALLR
jgi:hypothetical protein